MLPSSSRVPAPVVDGDSSDSDLGEANTAADLGAEPAMSKDVNFRPPQISRPPLSHRESATTYGDIRFRTDPQSRTLYAGGSGIDASPELSAMRAFPRKHSLVRVEDYLPAPSSRFSGEMAFNPYQSPSWSVKPDEFDRDLASPEASPHPSAGGDAVIAVSLQPNTSQDKLTSPPVFHVEYDTLNTNRTLGGKRLVKGGEWRKKMQLDAMKQSNLDKRRFSNEKELDEKADVYLGKMPQPDISVQQKRVGLLTRLTPFTGLLFILANMAYIGVRLYYLIQAEQRFRGSFVGGWIFFGIEMLFAGRFSIVASTSVARSLEKTPDRLRIKGDAFLPTVDVLILCTGQHDQIIMDTAMATARFDWPVDRIRILVIDDGCSSELQRRIESFASHRALHLSYHRRNKPTRLTDPAALKAALINFGLTETRMHGRQAGEYTLILEAECLPDTDILRLMVPHMLGNPHLGLLKCQQGFYNLPRHISAAFGTFVNAVEPAEDTRSGFIMRRCAVDEVGGFPAGSSVEDRTLSCLMSGKGYQSKTLHETLQYGLLPESSVVHLKQRLHRALGPLRTARAMQIFVGSPRLQRMPIFKRIGYLFGALQALLNVDVFLTMFAFPAALCLGQFLIPVLDMKQLYTLIRCLFAVSVTERIHELVMSNTQTNFSLRRQWIFLAPYQVPSLLGALMPSTFKQATSTAWPSDTSNRERDLLVRRPLSSRLRNTMSLVGSWLHVVAILFMLGGVAYSAGMVIKPAVDGLRDAKQTYLLILLTFGWPSLHWVAMINASWTAFSNTLFPPTVPPRDVLLIREPITGVARPAPEYRHSRPVKHSKIGEFTLTWLSTIYVSVLFGLTFVNGLQL